MSIVKEKMHVRKSKRVMMWLRPGCGFTFPVEVSLSASTRCGRVARQPVTYSSAPMAGLRTWAVSPVPFGRRSSGRRDVVERPFDRLAETWYIYVVGYLVLEDEIGDSNIDKEGT